MVSWNEQKLKVVFIECILPKHLNWVFLDKNPLGKIAI